MERDEGLSPRRAGYGSACRGANLQGLQRRPLLGGSAGEPEALGHGHEALRQPLDKGNRPRVDELVEIELLSRQDPGRDQFHQHAHDHALPREGPCGVQVAEHSLVARSINSRGAKSFINEFELSVGKH